MDAPTHLAHKPIVVVNDYDKKDGIYKNNTDARALSLGIAQYGGPHLTLKVFRHTGKKWSRQSEELPIHRNLDLTILAIKSIFHDPRTPSSLEEVILSEDGLQSIRQYYKDNLNELRPRLEEIQDLLNAFL